MHEDLIMWKRLNAFAMFGALVEKNETSFTFVALRVIFRHVSISGDTVSEMAKRKMEDACVERVRIS